MRRPAPGRAAPAALLLGCLLLAGSVWAAKEVPYLGGRVNDEAQMIPPALHDRMEEKLRDLEARTGAQVVVLTIASLEGETLEEYSVRVAQTWKLGRKGVDDGVLFLVAKRERKMRIEVGYGLEAKLTDLQSRRILDDVVRPQFRNGQFGEGVEAGVDAIVATIEGREVAPAHTSGAGGRATRLRLPDLLIFLGIFVSVVGIFSVIAVFAAGGTGWFLYVFLMPFYFAFPTAIFPPYGGLFAGLGWIIAFPVLRLWLQRTRAGKAFLVRHPRWREFAGSGGHAGSGGSWSSSGSSGGFSGGGGSFGGGGSSSSW